MARKSSLGLVAKPDKESIKIDVPRHRKVELDKLMERIGREAPEMTFDLGAVVDDALRIGIREASRALDARAKAGA